MSSTFIDENFLLRSQTAQHLFHDYAKSLPIIDYHNHLSAKEIYEDINFDSITDAWLGHDHYKWRTMRTCAVEENFITGDAPERQRFQKWCETVPFLIGNPLMHWTHLELQRYFDLPLLINESNAEEIWHHCNARLSQPEYSARNLLRRMNVESLCTTDDPLSDLEFHQALTKDNFEIKVLPTFRADELFYIEKKDKFLDWVTRLASKTCVDIDSIETLFSALEMRFNYFHEIGCRLSDIGIKVVPYESCSLQEADHIFRKVLAGKNISQIEIDRFKTTLFYFFGVQNKKRDWVMQLHIGVLQDPNQRRFEEVGPATGMSAIDDKLVVSHLAQLLSDLDYKNNLSKTIIYCLNPSDNAVIASLIGAFQGSDCGAGKIQFGSAWWFNDQKDGMLNQMKMLGNMGALGCFIGMLTDSRSLLSMPRHEYFRRILCNLIGQWVEEGEVPNDETMLKNMIEGICYRNAKHYFQLPA